MFDDNFDDTAGRYEISSLPAIREAALIMYGRFIAHMHGVEPNDDDAKMRHEHLSLQETENIVREHSFVNEDGVYAIGGDTQEEARAQVNEMLSALMDRVMSNVLSAGVKSELLDCTYDTNIDDFTFSVTDKGREIVDAERKKRNQAKPDRPDIPRDKEV